MKYKKILPLILVLMLVFTLTACDNWQRGIDEVQDADGPSWDLDLSVPLLPETNVPVGEELASFLDVEDEIEDLVIKPKYVLDEEDLDDQNYRSRNNQERISFMQKHAKDFQVQTNN